jgi:AAA+ superfamily predicted ATPase
VRLSDGIAHFFARYFRGILFLTTNRVKAFDQAFQSRIHLSLHYGELTNAAKEEIWKAFLDQVRTTRRQVDNLTQDELRELSVKDMNGREIKNVVKLAVALAEHEDEPLSFKLLVRTMNTVRDSKTTGLVIPRRRFRPFSHLGSRVYSVRYRFGRSK